MKMTAGRLRLCTMTAESPRGIDGGSRVNTQRQDINTLGCRDRRGIFSVALRVRKVVSRGVFGLLDILASSGPWNHIASVKCLYHPSSLCTNRREKLTSRRCCCFPRQALPHPVVRSYLIFSSGVGSHFRSCAGLGWGHALA